jgi:hypothetical protein
MILRNLKNETVLRIEVELYLNNGHKKWHGTQLISLQGTGIPAHE